MKRCLPTPNGTLCVELYKFYYKVKEFLTSIKLRGTMMFYFIQV